MSEIGSTHNMGANVSWSRGLTDRRKERFCRDEKRQEPFYRIIGLQMPARHTSMDSTDGMAEFCQSHDIIARRAAIGDRSMEP